MGIIACLLIPGANGYRWSERDALLTHRAHLLNEQDRLATLVATIDRTLAREHGTNSDDDAELFRGFAIDRDVLRDEIIERYAPSDTAPHIARSFSAERTRTAGWGAAERAAATQAGAAALRRLNDARRSGRLPGDPAVRPLVDAYRALMAPAWDPGPEVLLGFARMLRAPGFQRDIVAAVDPGLPDWLADALRHGIVCGDWGRP
ncbi:TipAS antibiotic-recognition domain-containing protein [Leucobacter sp. M11]|uniref:TipAS antibiotic-recognition domain-containing protein n=1 Tax=Leucobacter sp. M11 TaxID=2993565 RepID=UPI002D7ED1C2|nr:TipAS antibiotic-recognition domain-containing protein [Leucobacter sp. M11]MEB4616619.1 TipAS antibiotic-recognition domain-containing protein [Leucobacter sp. M11]